MGEILDYTIKSTNANIKDFDLTSNDRDVFPEGLYIGEWVSLKGDKFPALIPFSQIPGLLFLTRPDNREAIHRLMQSMALRLMLTLPPGLCRMTLYDAEGLGQNLIALSGISPQIIGDKILTEPEELKQALTQAKNDIPNVIQKVLGNRYYGKTLIDYNREAGEMAKPYHFFFITDYPRMMLSGYSQRDFVSTIEQIMKNGWRAGIFVVMSVDTTCEIGKSSEVNLMELLSKAAVIYEDGGCYHIQNCTQLRDIGRYFKLHLCDTFPDYNMVEAIQKKVNSAFREKKATSVKLSSWLMESNMWKSDGSVGVDVPIGMRTAAEKQHFVLSVENGVDTIPHHCLIGGTTGSGKTVLLHNIICNTAWAYSPNDVQFILMDYKEGTEFKVYESMPHVRVLSIQSEVEYGVSVFRYLDEEIRRRGELFKSYGLGRLSEYNARSSEKLPRLLVVIDEFQVLLSNSTSKNYIAKALDDIVRRGQSFGINLILSTQTLSEVDIKASTRSNLGLRIALKLNSSRDCDQLLGTSNDVPMSLSKKGEAIYNADGGFAQSNVHFQVAYISNEDLRDYIGKIRQSTSRRYGTDMPFKRYIYDGSMTANIGDNEQLKKGYVVDDEKCKVYVGVPVGIEDEHTYYELYRRNGHNVLIVGNDTDSAKAIVSHSVEQISKQSSNGGVLVLCDRMRECGEQVGQINVCETEEEIEECVSRLEEELKRRASSSTPRPRIVLCVFNISNVQSFQNRASSYKKTDSAQKLLTILKDGPVVGIHTIVYANSFANLKDVIGTDLNDFVVKIELNGGNGYKIFGYDSTEKISLKDGMGNMQVDNKEKQKFIIYN